jgi:hypothetical protein
VRQRRDGGRRLPLKKPSRRATSPSLSSPDQPEIARLDRRRRNEAGCSNRASASPRTRSPAIANAALAGSRKQGGTATGDPVLRFARSRRQFDPVAAEARGALHSAARALVLATNALPRPTTSRLSPAAATGVYGSGLEASEGRGRKQKWRAESTNPLHSSRIGDRRKQMEAGCSLMACKRSSARARLAPLQIAC